MEGALPSARGSQDSGIHLSTVVRTLHVSVRHAIAHVPQLGVEESSRGSGERKFILPRRLAIQSGVILASWFSLLPDHVLTV